jgi:hypothetical protein
MTKTGTGDRNFNDKSYIKDTLLTVCEKYGIPVSDIMIIFGGAKYIDICASDITNELNL